MNTDKVNDDANNSLEDEYLLNHTQGDKVRLKTGGDDDDVNICNLGSEKNIISGSYKHLILTRDQLESFSKEKLIDSWLQQDLYISSIQNQLEHYKKKEQEEKYRNQINELQRKEQYHVMRLASKEQEVQELGAQIQELKGMITGGKSLRHCLLDPAVNLLFERLKRDLDTARTKMEETQDELSAWKFTPDSKNGKQLMRKCWLLLKENEDLGKVISSGRQAKIEGELALQRNFNEEFKKSQSEFEEFMEDMCEDTEAMSSTIIHLQDQLRQAKQQIALLTQTAVPSPTTAVNVCTPSATQECGNNSEENTALRTSSAVSEQQNGRTFEDNCVVEDDRTSSHASGCKRTSSDDECERVREEGGSLLKRARTTLEKEAPAELEVVENGITEI